MASIATAVSTINVPFHGAELYVVNHNGEPYTPMKPIVEGMGMDWASQFTKMKQRFKTCIVKITMQLPGDEQRREIICLALRKLAGWLQTISPNKVRPEIRDKVIQYQEECDDVLYEYWTKGHVVNPRKAKKALPGKITTEQQEAIKQLVMSRGQSLPKEKQAKAMITMWSSLKSHFGCSYKEIDEDQFAEALSLVARVPLEGEHLPAGSASENDEVAVKMLDALREAIKTQTKCYGYPLKPGYRSLIHSPSGVLGLTENSLLMNLLNQLQDDGHDVSGAAAELTTMFCYIVGVSKCLRDIQTHAEYINDKAGFF
ncbi:phage antirepressor N-terminal domain-containing protein [Escherichia albertii]|uniref:phage antirepressor N-terminal domain-containing protein n=1 Tax=Escherichia albertii TaxID=208962 RepID=UPI0007436E91|nr:phage antirepressor N-terminal domain-containing protein [Escherichia albertii]MCV1961304.1 phage antirepressor N-terminal domain-containing protein [Escherichia coli]